MVRDLHKNYGSLAAVDGVSFEVGRNEILGLLGPNGDGKTTTINMVLGILEPSSGVIEIGGVDLRAHRSRALERTNFAAVYAAILVIGGCGFFIDQALLLLRRRLVHWQREGFGEKS